MTTAIPIDETEHGLAGHVLRLAAQLADHPFTLTAEDADGTPLRVLPNCTLHHPAIGWDAHGSTLCLALRQERTGVQHAAYHRLAVFAYQTPRLTLHEDAAGLVFHEYAPYDDHPLGPPVVRRTTRLTWPA
jgi:hypothetical protein